MALLEREKVFAARYLAGEADAVKRFTRLHEVAFTAEQKSPREVHVAGFARQIGAVPFQPCLHSRRKVGFSHKAVRALQAI